MKYCQDIREALECFRDRKCFLFDMDGLIFDTEQLFMEQLAVVMAEHGYHLSKNLYEQTLGMGGRTLADFMTGVYGESYPFEECSRQARERVMLIAEDIGLRVKPQIRESLELLTGWGKVCAVASSTPSGHVRNYLQGAGLAHYFREIIGGEMVQQSKPKPDIFQLACRQCGVQPAEAVVLEDSENGIRAAHAAGTGTICIPDLVQPSEDVRAWIDILVMRPDRT